VSGEQIGREVRRIDSDQMKKPIGVLAATTESVGHFDGLALERNVTKRSEPHDDTLIDRHCDENDLFNPTGLGVSNPGDVLYSDRHTLIFLSHHNQRSA
jgi:hypothetical protein